MRITIGRSQQYAASFAIYGTMEEAEQIYTEAVTALGWCASHPRKGEILGAPEHTWVKWLLCTPKTNKVTFSVIPLSDSIGVNMHLSVGGFEVHYVQVKKLLLETVCASAHRLRRPLLFDHPKLVEMREAVLAKVQEAFADVDVRRAMGFPSAPVQPDGTKQPKPPSF